MARMDQSYRPAAAFESACEILCKMSGEIGAGHLEDPGMAISIAAKVHISTHSSDKPFPPLPFQIIYVTYDMLR